MNLDEIFHNDIKLSKEEIIYLLNLTDHDDIVRLHEHARNVCKENGGEDIYFRGVLKFSNFCEDNCLFCGYREDNFSINRYRMSAEEIINAIRHISNLGLKSVILQSGKDSYYDTDLIAYIIYQIKNELDISISLSLRERGFDEYKTWKLAGAERYILNHEIYDQKLFTTTHQKRPISDRKHQLTYLKNIGYKIGVGTIVGLPSQTMENIASDLLFYQNTKADMVSLAPFLSIPFTPYQNMKNCDLTLFLKVISVARLLMPDAYLPCMVSYDHINKKGIEKAISAGANAVLANFTPTNYTGRFTPTKNNTPFKIEESEKFLQLRARIKDFGLNLTGERGKSISSY